MNNSEMFAREKKAAKLANACFRIGATAEEVLSATADDWEGIAKLASEWSDSHTNPPNKKNPKPTVDAVLALLARAYADEAAKLERKAEGMWEESQEYGGNRCPERE